MNKITISIFILMLISTASCKKFLETKPTDFAVPEQFYNTEQQLNEALAGVYSSLTTTNTYGLYTSFFYQAGTDEGFYKLSTSVPQPANYNITPAEPKINNTWRDLYSGINRANNLLANISKPAMSEKNRNVIKGETLFLRAFMYYYLVLNFGDVPLLLSPTVDSRQVNNPATPAKAIYEQVLKDMKEAKDLVNPYDANGSPVHVCKTAIQAMLARVCLSMAGQPLSDVAKYVDARAWADSVIQSRTHALNPDYKQIFINESADLFDNAYKEVLWEIDFYGNNNDALKLGGRWTIYMGVRNTNVTVGYSYGYMGATGYLYNLYKPGDLRRDWAIAPYQFLSSNSPTKVYLAPTDIYTRTEGKWRREYETVAPKNTEYNSTNFPMIRYADVLLMYAEADNEINGAPGSKAYDALNMVRRRAYGLSPNTAVASVAVVNTITLATTGNTGYATTAPVIPVTLSGGGGTGATAIASVSATTRKVTAISITNPGFGYTSAPTVIIGSPWQPNTSYPAGAQVFNGNNLYTVETAGTSGATAPTNTSGNSNPAVTGITFTYAGLRATATAAIGSSAVDLTSLNAATFRDAIREERARELCFEALRKHDLIRWGIFVPRLKQIEAEMNLTMPASLKYAISAYSNVSEKHQLFPIPGLELSLNTAMEQSPLWR